MISTKINDKKLYKMKNIKLKILRFLKTVTSYLDTKFKILKNKQFKLTKPTVKKILSLSNLNINLNKIIFSDELVI